MRPLTMLLVLAALGIGVAGCGGGSDSAADTSATTTESTTTTETTSEATDTSMTETTSTEASGFDFGSGDCRKLAEASKNLGQSLSAATTDKEKLQQAKELYQRFVDSAPSEIKPDLQVLADAYSKIVDAVGNLDLKAGETPDAATIQKFQQAMASIDNAKVQKASQNLTAWVTANCGTGG